MERGQKEETFDTRPKRGKAKPGKDGGGGRKEGQLTQKNAIYEKCQGPFSAKDHGIAR